MVFLQTIKLQPKPENMQIKHIYWFAYFNKSEPSVRYRATFPLQYMKAKHGITYSLCYPGYDFTSIFRFLSAFFSALLFRKKDSVIVFQKIYTNGLYARALKLLLFFRPWHTLYDIDDAEHTRRNADTIHYFMKHCSACAAGSRALVEYIKPFNPHVLLLTSPVIDHGRIKKGLEQTFTIGWVGYYGAHRQSLMQLFFPALLAVDFPVKLKLLGVCRPTEEEEVRAYFSSNKHISIEAPLQLDWLDEPTIYEAISTFDVGVSPLLDTEFNRSKSAFKLKQCLSCGVPVLGSSTGENSVFLSDGVNGYFCNTPADYLQKITALRQQKNGSYARLSRNAQSSFTGFSVEHYCITLLKYYEAG